MTVIAQLVTSPDLNGEVTETIESGATSVVRSLVVDEIVAEVSTGGGTSHIVTQKITLKYERTEQDSANPPDRSFLDDAPAVAPYKTYRITIEEI